MKKYFQYLMIYSILGFFLERIINMIALGEYFDNSVLYGPYQPLYGSGILMAIIFYDLIINKRVDNKYVKTILLLITAIITTAIAEAVTGFGYEYLYDVVLWNYSEFFSCQYYYVCLIPTSIFGFGSFLVIKYFHTYIESFVIIIPNYLTYSVLLIFLADIFYTFFM